MSSKGPVVGALRRVRSVVGDAGARAGWGTPRLGQHRVQLFGGEGVGGARPVRGDGEGHPDDRTGGVDQRPAGAAANPLPSCSRSQACPSTRTVEAWTRLTVAGSSPDSAGGGPAAGESPRPSKTRGKLSLPTSCFNACSVLGGAGRLSSTSRAI